MWELDFVRLHFFPALIICDCKYYFLAFWIHEAALSTCSTTAENNFGWTKIMTFKFKIVSLWYRVFHNCVLQSFYILFFLSFWFIYLTNLTCFDIWQPQKYNKRFSLKSPKIDRNLNIWQFYTVVSKCFYTEAVLGHTFTISIDFSVGQINENGCFREFGLIASPTTFAEVPQKQVFLNCEIIKQCRSDHIWSYHTGVRGYFDRRCTHEICT